MNRNLSENATPLLVKRNHTLSRSALKRPYYTYIHTYMHPYSHTRMQAYTYLQTSIHHTRTHMYMHALNTCAYMLAYIHVDAYMYVDVYMYEDMIRSAL